MGSEVSPISLFLLAFLFNACFLEEEGVGGNIQIPAFSKEKKNATLSAVQSNEKGSEPGVASPV